MKALNYKNLKESLNRCKDIASLDSVNEMIGTLYVTDYIEESVRQRLNAIYMANWKRLLIEKYAPEKEE